MNTAYAPKPVHAFPDRRTYRVGCVSFLNAKPLIEGVENLSDVAVRFAVPSRLLAELLNDQVDITLCPVIDYYRSPQPFVIVPVGGIGSHGPTLTVRLFSRVPLEQIRTVYADTDSHTSVALLRVLLRELYNLQPEIRDYPACDHAPATAPPALLLIGDKVVHAYSPATIYPHQLDLGEGWLRLTGLPFVFAVWMAKPQTDLGDLPHRLDRARQANRQRIDAIADRHAAAHGWNADLARQYLGHMLRYQIETPQLQAIERFGALAHRHGLIDAPRPLQLWQDDHATS